MTLLRRTLILAAPLILASVAFSQVRQVGASTPNPAKPSWEITEAVEAATRRGLAYLAKRQSSAGYWVADVGFKNRTGYRVAARGSEHVGVTAFALMAFLACGELPGRGKYGDNALRATNYLVQATAKNGYISSNGTRMYSHALATLALAEVYGTTTRKDLRASLQLAVNLIADCQNHEGGWRYKPFSQESDLSITVCQVMALRAARNSGIFVPKNVIAKAIDYVRRSEAKPGDGRTWSRWGRRSAYKFVGGAFRYQLERGSRTSFAMSAAGVTTLFGAGVYDDPLVERGLDFLIENFEGYAEHYDRHYFFYYGNYYAVQALYVAGGKRWKRYFTWTRDFLIHRQEPDGSWRCDVGPGKTFGTAVATLILAIPYNYLPIFQR